MPASIKHLSDKKVCYNSLLARWTDGLYYAAALTKVDKTKKTCRVAFEDGSEIWVSNRDVHIQLTIDQLSEDEDIVCCICDDGNSEPPNEIILCDVCQQGYHQNCHIPPVDSSKLDASEDTKDHKDWFCATCSYILNQTNRAKLSAAAAAVAAPSTAAGHQQSRHHQAHPSPARAGPATPQPSKSRQPPPASVPVPASKVAATSESRTPIVPRQPPRVKQTPPSAQQQQLLLQQQRSTIGSIKPPPAGSHQRSAPYYPLSNQVRAAVASSSSSAALASMTASSALVVGGSAGRSKQDLVKQSNRTSQRQGSDVAPNDSLSVLSPPKHAVRKSGVNYVVGPMKQSALPTATRSVPSPVTAAATNNGPSVRDSAISRPQPATIISTQTGTLSVLTSPSKQHTQQQEKIGRLNESAGSAANATAPDVKNGEQKPRMDVAEKTVSQQSANVTSSDLVSATPQGKVANNDSSESAKAPANKLEKESVVHSTGDHQRHITDSPQLEISFEHSPDQSVPSPPSQEQGDANPTTNGSEERGTANKSTTVIVGGTQSG